MTDIPKCTHWLGHKFEGRYSKTPARQATENELFWSSVFDQLAIAETHRAVTYERDICVRCGVTVEKKP